jgi:hypothetical protein
MLNPVKENDPGFIVAWHSKHKHQAGKFQDKPMTWGEAHLEAEKLEKEHPENTYWAEHLPQEFSPH